MSGERRRKGEGEYPPDILMVGGAYDGEYYKGAPQDVIRVAKPTPIASMKPPKRGELPQVAAEIRHEVYRLRQFSADNQVLILYALDSLSDFDVQMSLIRGYRRPHG